MLRIHSIVARSLTRSQWVAASVLSGVLLATSCSDGGITVPPPVASNVPTLEAVVVLDSMTTADAGVSTGSMTNGGNHSGTISIAGQTDTWTFTATQGQYIAVAIGEVSGVADFTPWIRLLDPNGATIGNNWNVAAAQIGVAAPLTGTYTVLAATADPGFDATGTYRIMSARLQGSFIVSGGDQGGPMTNGSNHTGALVAGDLDLWSFTATQGTAIYLAIGEVSGDADFTPWIRLIAPNGAVLGDVSNVAAAQIVVGAPSTGTYTVIVGTADNGLDATGNYTLSTANSPGAISISPGDQGGPMTNGSTHLGTITVGDLDAWTFTATQGTAIYLGIGEITGTPDFAPYIRLVSPSGVFLGHNWNTAAAQLEAIAPETGTYLIIVTTADAGNDATGDYRLSIANSSGSGAIVISPGDQGGPMVNGSNHLGSQTVGDIDAWTFTATQGSALYVGIGEVSGDLDYAPFIRLVAPNGAVLGSAAGVAAAQIGSSAPVDGTYLVIVTTSDAGNDASGTYTLSIANAPGAIVISPGDQGGPMTNGVNHTGTLTVGDLDAWTFTANQGEYVQLAVGEITGSADYTPYIRLISPNGTFLAHNWNVAAAQISVNAPLTGTYLVILTTADAGNDATGDYNVTLAKSGPITTSPGDQGGNATNGGNNLGAIHVGDLDVYTFTSNQGLPFAVSIGEVSGTADFTPWIAIVSPNGTLMGTASGVAAAQLSAIAPLTGAYTVIVTTGDAGNDDTGNYRLVVQKAGAFVTPPGDEGGAMTNGAIHTGTIVVGDLDRWTFTANQNDAIALSVGEVSGNDFTPWIRLVAPSGAVIGNNWDVLVAQLNTTAPETGTYTIAIGTADAGIDGTGNYNLTMAKGPGSFIVSPGDQGGAISNGVQSGSISAGGDLDMWSITATVGSPIALTVSEVSGTADYTPWIRLVAPNGVVIGNNAGTTFATINVSAPTTGTYTIILGTADAGNDATGSYNLSVSGVNFAPQPNWVAKVGQLDAFMSPRPTSYGLDGKR